ncbi:sirohydrochlorin cobaltochelatase, partial [Pseudomonas aeruginosa]|nr:sirohydrochlorin cobaltochelatase [Pseudomonas aeruginosa]
MKKALLVVSFGTSYHDTREKNIAACERDLAASCPDRTLFRAFTSGMIIRKLQQRDGI